MLHEPSFHELFLLHEHRPRCTYMVDQGYNVSVKCGPACPDPRVRVNWGRQQQQQQQQWQGHWPQQQAY